MKILNVAVLVNDSTTAKAYLLYMAKYGYMPRKIIFLDFVLELGVKSKAVRFFLGDSCLKKLKKIKQDRLDRKDWDVYRSLFDTADEIDLSKRFDYRDYCVDYVELQIENINDSELIEYIKKDENNLFIFTGGGIVKQDLLAINGKSFVHVHPGIVPEIKGSDGLLWSLLLRGKPGMSCFYMDAGIDTGTVLYKKEYAAPAVLPGKEQTKSDAVYRVLLKFFDPRLRALTLVELLKKIDAEGGDVNKIEACKQKADGRTYFSMHELLVSEVVSKLMRGLY